MNLTPIQLEQSRQIGHGICALQHLGVIKVQGADAVTFLQGQLSNDFALLTLNKPQLAAYCSAKGRMLASLIGIKTQSTPDLQEVFLVLPRDVLTATLKRLSMFVLRAKLNLSDITEALPLYGVLPSLQILIAPAPSAIQSHGELLELRHWHHAQVLSGVAHITTPIVDLFVPQMLNYESVGGVSFKKGCYPGQEIVARSQFRGAIKRRTYLVESQHPVNVGDEVYAAPSTTDELTPANAIDEMDISHGSDAQEAQTPVGVIVQAAQHPDSAKLHHALVCMQTAAASSTPLLLRSPTGTTLTLLPLPYPLLADI